MAVTIRQEINLITDDLSATGSSTVNDSGLSQLDTTQYVNPTYYFEVVARVTAGSSDPSLSSFGTVDGNISILTFSHTNTTYTRVRSPSFTPTAGQQNFNLRISPNTSTVDVKSARIIIIDNPTTLTSTETQIEIGMNKTGLTSSVSSPKVVPDTTLTKYWKYTAANWDGTQTFFAEVTYLMASSKSGGTFVLQEDNGSFASWTDKVTIVSAGVATVATRVRSASFTPTDGRNYRIAYFVASSKSAASIFNAKIIVGQTNTTIIDSYALSNKDSAQATGSGLPRKALGESFTGNGSVITDAIFNLAKFSTPTNNMTVAIYAETHATAFGTDSLPTGLALAVSDTIDASTLSTTAAGITFHFSGVNQITLTNGTHYVAVVDCSLVTGEVDVGFDSSGPTASGNSTSYNGTTWSVFTATGDLVFIVENIGSSPTLLEPQYLLLNTADSNATGVQSYQTLIDKTNEWAGVTLTGKHAMDSDNASNSLKLRDITAPADVTSSTVTGANQQISGDIWANFTDGNQVDTWVLNTTGVIAASRILVGVTVSSAVNVSIAQVAGTVTAAGGTQAISANVLANASVTQVAATVTASGGTQAVSTALNATVAQVAATVTATGGTQTLATVNDVAITQIAGTVTAAGGTQSVATVNKVAISQLAGTVTASGGTQTIAAINNVSIAQIAGVVTAAGGTQAIATSNFVAISQLAATVTASGGTQLAQTNSSIAQVAATVTASGGTQSVATVNIVGITQVAGSVTAAGGTQVITTSNFVAISQLAGTVTATGGTQTLATVNDVAISQLAATVTASGGTQTITAGGTVSIAQVAATVTAAGGTQAVSTVNIVAISQTAASVTASGGTQSLATVNDVAISQVAGTVTVSGGTQAVASSQFTTVTQSAASVTATGGTQTVTTVNNGIVAQLAATVTASGGTQAIATVNNVTLSQVAGTVTASGGTQSLTAQIDAAIAQLAANVIATGGTQGVSASSGAASVSITQVGATVTATGGLQVITTSTGPLPSSRPPSTILLTDGHVAVRLGANLYLPL